MPTRQDYDYPYNMVLAMWDMDTQMKQAIEIGTVLNWYRTVRKPFNEEKDTTQAQRCFTFPLFHSLKCCTTNNGKHRTFTDFGFELFKTILPKYRITDRKTAICIGYMKRTKIG